MNFTLSSKDLAHFNQVTCNSTRQTTRWMRDWTCVNEWPLSATVQSTNNGCSEINSKVDYGLREAPEIEHFDNVLSLETYVLVLTRAECHLAEDRSTFCGAFWVAKYR